MVSNLRGERKRKGCQDNTLLVNEKMVRKRKGLKKKRSRHPGSNGLGRSETAD